MLNIVNAHIADARSQAFQTCQGVIYMSRFKTFEDELVEIVFSSDNYPKIEDIKDLILERIIGENKPMPMFTNKKRKSINKMMSDMMAYSVECDKVNAENSLRQRQRDILGRKL